MRKSGSSPEMNQYRSSFPQALRRARNALGVSQEAFDLVSSRTYISAMERGIKQPTLGKVDDLAEVLGIHPLTLLALCFDVRNSAEAQQLLSNVGEQLAEIFSAEGTAVATGQAKGTRTQL
jgi:transcriptional regulator with XRE-family HTH domain